MLKIFQLNCQDLSVFMDKYDGEDLEELFPPKWQLFSSSFFPNKPLEKLIEIKGSKITIVKVEELEHLRF